MYPWGNAFAANKVVYESNSEGQTADVGSKPEGASWVGALDMSGNVWEWTLDWYSIGYYNTLEDNVVNPVAPTPSTTDDGAVEHAIRGASWSNPLDSMYASNRYWATTRQRTNNVGFRCALSAEDSVSLATTPATIPVPVAATPIPARSPNSGWTPVKQDFDGVEMMLVPAGVS